LILHGSQKIATRTTAITNSKKGWLVIALPFDGVAEWLRTPYTQTNLLTSSLAPAFGICNRGSWSQLCGPTLNSLYRKGFVREPVIVIDVATVKCDSADLQQVYCPEMGPPHFRRCCDNQHPLRMFRFATHNLLDCFFDGDMIFASCGRAPVTDVSLGEERIRSSSVLGPPFVRNPN
jgi:hypothetical protein